MTATEHVQDHVDRNYEVFKAHLPELMRTSPGKWALLYNENLEAVFDTANDAYIAGRKLYPDGLFSIQEVRAWAVDLGWYSHVLPLVDVGID